MKNLAGLFLFCLVSHVAHSQGTPLFESLPASFTGVNFKNNLKETPKSNVLTYEYFYNGGGVAVGDINNDGLDDIYFTSNKEANALFLNLGNMKFKEIGRAAGVQCDDGWKTGVTMTDVNGDGNLDIYVCLSGKGDPEQRRNKLYINNGDLTFTEKSAAYGLDDPGHATHASFFDFDRDGDLDVYLLNHNVVVIREFEFTQARSKRHPYAGDKLMRNDNGHFVDISEAAGIKGNALGFGLGITVADINKDGWMDMYVSNDYVEPDYLYINNHNGTFTDRMTDYMQHISHFSMGCDVSDFNNDEWPDIFTLDMLPEDNERQKLLYGPENYEHYALTILNGFYLQNMRNMLHLNNGNGTYSEIGQFAGVSKTDWSWAPLFADYDNDGWKDLFITNGYYRDYTNRDFLKYKGDYYFEKGKAKEKADTFHLVTTMTSTPVHNYMYRNNGDLTFSDQSEAWGFKERNFSNGCAYSDLDNDGDLDLVVSNQNATASIYKNLSRERFADQNFIQVALRGSGANTRAIGAKIRVYGGGKPQYFEKAPTRGFQSSVGDRIHIGLGKIGQADSIKIEWPLGGSTTLRNISANQLLQISELEHRNGAETGSLPNPANLSANNIVGKDVTSVFTKAEPLVNYDHLEEGFNDFKRQPLLLTMLTQCGPIMAQGDVNDDGRVDLYVGGAQGKGGNLFLQNAEGSYFKSPFNPGKQHTDADALFFDADGDKDLDLYIVSGGYNDYQPGDKTLQDRLYINDGVGQFTLSVGALPEMLVSKSCVAASDYDHDGDVDLFVGGRVVPGQYPVTPESFILENNGGRFQKNSAARMQKISRAGMVTDAEWIDLDHDTWEDLVIVGEFMAVEVFLNKQGKNLEQATRRFFDYPLTGLWNKMIVNDFDNDGDQDLIVGNLGLNTQLRATPEQPIALIYKDFDKNGSIDPIMNHYIQNESVPFPSRDELLDQLYGMRSKFTNYAAYSKAKIDDIFSKADLKDASVLRANELASIYLENRQGKFVAHKLPQQAQFSPIYAMTLLDYNKDGKMDVVMAGNQSAIRIRMGVIDANFGQLFEGDGEGGFKYVRQAESGLNFTGDTKSLSIISIGDLSYLLVGTNNVGLSTYKLNSVQQGGD